MLLAGLATGRVAHARTITTVAGTGTPGFSGDGGPATAAQLAHPGLVALDGAGNLFIDDQLGRIRRVDATTGIITTVAGIGGIGFSGDGGPATAAAIRADTFAVDATGNLFLGDYYAHRIRRVDAATGVITTYVGNGYESCFHVGDGGPASAAQLCNPLGLAVDGSGNLFIADSWDGIRRVDAATGIITSVAPGAFQYVTGVGVDGAENLYVFNNGDDPPGLSPQGNHIYRVDAFTNNVTAIAGNGVHSFSGDGGLATLAGIALSSPVTLAVDGAGNLFMGDLGVRVRRIDAATGIITTVAGNGTVAFSGDGGPANMAGLAGSEVALAGNGGFYIGDFRNYRVRFVSLQPATCGDGIPNPGEQCDAGAANGPPASCCTAACGFAPAGSGCSDNDACTQNDQCNASGLCVGGGAVDCENGDPCSVNTCDSATGCVHSETTESLGGGELGCIPPNRDALACANRTNKDLGKLAATLLRCHSKSVAAVLAQAPFDEEGCESKAQSKYVAATANLVGCPACLDRGAVGDAMTTLIESRALATLYCDDTSGEPLSDADDAGFLPADAAAAKCDAKTAQALWRLIGAEVHCHTTLAADDVAGASFGVGTCEYTAESRFAAATSNLTGCPACLIAQLPALESDAGVALDQQNTRIYCTP